MVRSSSVFESLKMMRTLQSHIEGRTSMTQALPEEQNNNLIVKHVTNDSWIKSYSYTLFMQKFSSDINQISIFQQPQTLKPSIKRF